MGRVLGLRCPQCAPVNDVYGGMVHTRRKFPDCRNYRLEKAGHETKEMVLAIGRLKQGTYASP